MKTLILGLAAAALACAQGMKPRPDAGDYPAHAGRPGLAIGAVMLGSDQVHKTFSTDLNRGYLVVEVAVYPKTGTWLDLGPGDFSLRMPDGEVLRPVAPQVIARALTRPPGSGRGPAIYPGVGIGYGGGRGMYGGGVGTEVGVGVGRGGPRGPAWGMEDRKTMEMELGEGQVPERLVEKPVAGYLYFPAPKAKVRSGCQLQYQSPAASLTLDLPAPPRK